MKRFLLIALFVTLSSIAANAQCDTEALTATYQKFLENHKGTPEQKKAANETAKEYLSKFGECTGEEEKKITAFIRDWQTKFEAGQTAGRIETDCKTAVDKTPAKAFQLCQPLLAKDPENLRTHLLLSLAGLKTASDKSLRDQTVKITRKTLDLINSGKTVDNWILGPNKEETVATLEFYSATLTFDTTPADTATAMLNLAKGTTTFSKNPSTFLYLGRALDKDIDKQLAEYKTKCTESTPDCDAAYAKIEASIDRVIDAFARAVALSANKPENAAVATEAKAALTTRYKQRHEDSDAGLDKFVAEVLAKPIP